MRADLTRIRMTENELYAISMKSEERSERIRESQAILRRYMQTDRAVVCGMRLAVIAEEMQMNTHLLRRLCQGLKEAGDAYQRTEDLLLSGDRRTRRPQRGTDVGREWTRIELPYGTSSPLAATAQYREAWMKEIR